MLRKLFAAALCCFMAFAGIAQDKDIPKELYNASTIPDSLKTEAHAVIRYSNDEIVVKDVGKVSRKHHIIETLLDEKAERDALIILFYNKKYNNFSNVEIKVYNAGGMVMKKYRKSDMYDRSAVEEETIITDERLMAIKHDIASYPATIELSYEEDLTSYTDLNDWSIRPNQETSVQHAVCKVEVNPAIGFRFKPVNIDIQPIKTLNNGLDTYAWQVNNLKASKPEENILPWQTTQKVLFACNKFEYYAVAGDFDSWQSFGKWIATLNNGGNNLSPERAAEIRKMTDSIKSDKEKVKFLYRYLQQNMHYVSIQLGIGGYKPFTASFVDQKKYGDCKALSNYMNALLNAVNIPSYYAIINAGTNEPAADPAFPDNAFNHAILCVPLKGDTTWLECTSNTQPFGKLGTFTENRRALLVTEDGGKLVNTPRSVIGDNTFEGFAHVILAADGSAKSEIKLKTTGEYRAMYVGMEAAKQNVQKEFLIRYLNLKQPISFDFKDAPDDKITKELNMELDYDRFYDMAVGNKQFYKPEALDVWHLTLPEVKQRKADYYFEHPMQKACTTTIDLPAGFEMESLPQNVKLKFSYGDYESTYRYDQAKNQVINTTKFNLYNQVIPAAKYNELQQYMDDIAKAQSKKLVIKRKA